MTYEAAVVQRLSDEARQLMARYPSPRSALLPMLHLVQAEDGYVSPDGIALCAELLDLTAAEVSAVATFYTQYKRHPAGTYNVGVCINTLCAIMGGDAIWEELSDHLGIGHDETTEDGVVTLERLECNAACDYAPVVMINWEFFDNQTAESAVALVDALRAGKPVTPTRGANTVVTFKEMSRILAGFPDGRVGEGVGAGEPTKQGTLLAQREGWTAPPFPSEAGGEPEEPQADPDAEPTAGSVKPTASSDAEPTPESAQPDTSSDGPQTSSDAQQGDSGDRPAEGDGESAAEEAVREQDQTTVASGSGTESVGEPGKSSAASAGEVTHQEGRDE